jgi:dTDP-4-dehydrorhamnose reductase
MPNILIMGKTGMLGSMLFHYLSKIENYDIYSTSRGESTERNLCFDAENSDLDKLTQYITDNNIEYVINAIGIINTYCRDSDLQGLKRAEIVNAKFPHQLSKITGPLKIKTIQIATDCVYDGAQGGYNEDSPHNPKDAYGKTKSLGEINDGSILNLRCSIIGPELKSKVSLLEWFLKQDSEIKGFTHHRWNGVTTLRFAHLIDHIIQKNSYEELVEKSPLYHYVPEYVLTKYEMLETFKKVFKKATPIKPVDNVTSPIDRTLKTKFDVLPATGGFTFESEVEALKEVMDSGFYA